MIKQTSAYRKPRYDIPFYLEGRPHSVQSLCLLNIERGRKIPKSYFIQLPQDGMFTVTKSQSGSKSDDDWKVDIHGGTCTCPAFLSSNIPCKHMFPVFHHFPKWSWDNLPKALTNSPHMTLDQNLTDASELHLHVHYMVTTSRNLATVKKSMHVLSLAPTQPRPYLPRSQKEPKSTDSRNNLKKY